MLRLSELSPWVLNSGWTVLNKLRGRDDFMTVLFSDGNIYLRKPETESLRENEGARQAARGEAILSQMMPCFPSFPVQALPGHPSLWPAHGRRGHMAGSLQAPQGGPASSLASPDIREFLPPCLAFKAWAGFPLCRCSSVFPPPS